MAIDFRASQFRGAKFISSGSTGTGAKILFYDIAADSATTPNIGAINTAKFGTGSIGTDIFLYVSGGIGSAGVANSQGTTVFGGDVVVSGNLTLSGNLLSEIWVDGGNKAYTTSSVAISSDALFAQNYGSDIFFFVSGNVNGNSTANNKTVLPDTILSGNIWMKSSSQNPRSTIFNGNRTGGIVLSGSNVSLIEISAAGKVQVTNTIDNAIVNSDVFLFVSGNKGTRDKVSLFGGDTFVSGTLYIGAESDAPAQLFFVSGAEFPLQIYKDNAISWYLANYDTITPDLNIYADTGKILLNAPTQYISSSNFIVLEGFRFKASRMSGSLQRLTDNTPAFVSGGNIQITTQSNGAVAISGSATYIMIGSYASTTLTSSSPQVAGQTALDRTEFFNVGNIYLRNILSTTTGSVTASLMLFNISSGSYVHIGGPSITILSTSNTTPTIKQSVNLLNATNFITGSEANVYEVQIYVSTGSQQAILGSSTFVCV
jgi:hypothetical protein